MNVTIPTWLEPAISFLKAHMLLSPIAIAVAAFIESFAFIGILTPGTVILPALGFVAGTLAIPMPIVFFCCYIGAFVGDTSSYFLGRYCKEPILAISLVKKYQHFILDAEKYFQKWGILSLALGRFIGPLRPILPFLAGSFKVSLKLFLLLNALTAIGWTILYCMLGFYAGAATLGVAH